VSDQGVIGIYDSMSKAEETVYTLDRGRFPIKQVSIVAQHLQNERRVNGYVTVTDAGRAGAMAGAWLGGLLGLLTGVAFMWMPGFAPLILAGHLASVLLALVGGVDGAIAGVAWGGVLGILVGVGVSREHIIRYKDHAKAGKYLVIAHGSGEEVERARTILQRTAATESHVHAEAGSQASWGCRFVNCR
jgi:outer membrane lipoprotein SlyB